MLRFYGAGLLNALENWGYCLDGIFIVHSLGKPPRLTAEEHAAILAGLLAESGEGEGCTDTEQRREKETGKERET